MNEIQKHNGNGNYSVIEQVVIGGDLKDLNPAQRVEYYSKVCESLGLNPYTKPFDYITLNGKLTLYAKKDATDQLRKIHGISITALDGRIMDDLYIVTATAQDANGRTDQATGAVNIGSLKGEAKANAIMKAETKAKRRVTLSIAGLGWTDETETDSIHGAKPVKVDTETGEIIETPAIVQAWANGSTAVDSALKWAVEIGAQPNEDEAKEALRVIVDDTFGGKFKSSNLVDVLTEFYHCQQVILSEIEESK